MISWCTRLVFGLAILHGNLSAVLLEPLATPGASLGTSIGWTSNAEEAQGGSSDTTWTLSGSAFLERSQGIVALNASLNGSLTHFFSLEDREERNLSASLNASFPNGLNVPYDLSAVVSLTYVSSLSNFVAREGGPLGSIADRQTDSLNMNASLSGAYTLSPLWSLNGSLSYGQAISDFNDSVFLESRGQNTTFGFNAGLGYEFLSRISMDFSYGLSRTLADDAAGLDSTTHTFRYSASGALTTFLNGSVNIGLSGRTFDSGSAEDDWTPVFSANLDFDPGELRLFDITLNMGRNFAYTQDNRASINTFVQLGYSYKITEQINFSSNLGYTLTEVQSFESAQTGTIPASKQETLSANAGLRYSIRPNLSANLNLSYSDTLSDQDVQSYAATSANAGLSYSF